MASFTITSEREEIIDFSSAFYEDASAILLPGPTPRENITAFLLPFSPKVRFYVTGGVNEHCYNIKQKNNIRYINFS